MAKMSTGKMDAEYNCMRRRMSRARGKVGKGSLEAEDVQSDDDGGFKNLIKFWKKHGIPIPKDLISDMADEQVKISKARGQGRRRSRELEDLHLCASTGSLSLSNVDENEEEHEERGQSKSPDKTPTTAKKPMIRRQTDSVLGSKTASRGGSLKKNDSKSSLNGLKSKKSVTRSISHNK